MHYDLYLYYIWKTKNNYLKDSAFPSDKPVKPNFSLVSTRFSLNSRLLILKAINNRVDGDLRIHPFLPIESHHRQAIKKIRVKIRHQH
jgi:hypothetical protein